MGKIIKKLNGVYFESSLDTGFWFLLGVVITLLSMATLVLLGMGMAEMVLGMLLEMVFGMLDTVVVMISGWGEAAATQMATIFAALEGVVFVVVCLVVSVAVVLLSVLLAIKKPEAMRTKSDMPAF
jgi:hypothetical protein